MRKSILWILLLPIALTVVQAEAADRWLKKKNPDELYAFVDVSECPISTQDLTEQIHEMLIRSRIKPLTTWNPGDIALYASADCVATSDGGWLFRVTTRLAEIKQGRGDDVVISYREQDDFSLFGKGSEATLRQNAMEAAENAFRKYLNANFDLEPD